MIVTDARKRLKTLMLLDQRVELKDRVAAKELHNLLSDIRNKTKKNCYFNVPILTV